jgi:hypothetical protein
LKQTALRQLRGEDTGRSLQVPALINFGDVAVGDGRLARLLRVSLPETPPEFTFGNLLDAGLVCILVDDVDFSSTRRMATLLAFIEQFPRNRYIFSTTAGIYENFGAAKSIPTTVSFVPIFMGAFRRRDMRLLVDKWDAKRVLDQDLVLDRLVTDIVHINEPLTAVNGSILLSILEEHSQFTPINKAVLIERFVETLLQKGSLQ